MEETKYISPKDAYTILGITHTQLRGWEKKGKLTAVRHPMNNFRMYKREEIEEIAKKLQEFR